MPRLMQAGGGGRSNGHGHNQPGAASVRRQQGERERVRMPQYERPSYPLTDDAQRELSNMSQRADARTYEKHLEKSLRLLSDSVFPINEVLETNKHRLQEMETRRVAKASETEEEAEKSAIQMRWETLIEKMEGKVEERTREIEKMVREVVDYKVEVLDVDAAMAATVGKTERRLEAYKAEKERIVAENAQRKRMRERREAERRTNGGAEQDEEDSKQNEEEDELEEPEEDAGQKGITPIRAFKEARHEQRDEYDKVSAYDRYAKDNDYIGFRKTLHDAQHPFEEMTVPSARHWFNQHGEPINIIPGRDSGKGENGVNYEEEDEDEDLVVAKEVRDYRCPLSMTALQDPLTSNKCPHSFEKKAAQDYLRQNRGSATCPVSGCSQLLRMTDLFEDTLLKRKIEKAKRIAQQEDEDNDENDDDDDESPPGSNP